MKQKDYDILRELRRLSGGEDNEFEMAVAVGRTFDENCNFSDLDGAIGKLALPRESKASRSLGIYIDFLSHIGFKSHSLERVDLAHSSVAWALAEKRGLPITLAILFIELARRLGFDSFGVNFPGHFLLSISGSLVDPSTLSVVDRKTLSSKLEGADRTLLDQPASPAVIAMRMLNNIKNQYLQSNSLDLVLQVLDQQEAVSSSHAEFKGQIHFERGETYGALGRAESALSQYELALTCTDNPSLREVCRRRMEFFKGASEVLH